MQSTEIKENQINLAIFFLRKNWEIDQKETKEKQKEMENQNGKTEETFSEPKKFFKYPKTVHMSGSSVVDDDVVVNPNDWKILLKNGIGKKIVVQEKVDGANVGVHFEQEWMPIIQKRSGLVGTSEKPQYDVWRNWCYENMEALWEVLGTQYCLFGEVCNSKLNNIVCSGYGANIPLNMFLSLITSSLLIFWTKKQKNLSPIPG